MIKRNFTIYNAIMKGNYQPLFKKMGLHLFTLTVMLLLVASASAQAPANDDPCNAIVLTADATCSFTSATTLDATGSAAPIAAPSCGAGYQGGDVWFQVVVPDEGAIKIETQDGDIFDGGMAIYSGDCDALNEIDCNDDNPNGSAMPTITATGLTPGTTVWIRFWESGNDNNGTFGICVTIPAPPPPAPANDDPCNAIDITVGTECNYETYTNLGATDSNVPDPSCALYQGEDVWFSAVVPDGGGLIIETQAAEVLDGAVAIYDGTCDALNEIDCNDDAGVGLNAKLVATGLTPGSTVWIRFWSYNGNNTGTFGICVRTPPAAPANDEPCNGIVIPVGDTCNYITYTNESATPSVGVPAPGCANYQGGDVWFTVTVPDGGALLLDTKQDIITDGGMAIYGGACDALNLIACNDNSSGNGAMPLINVGGLIPGSTLWIRVWEYGNDNNGTFGLCVTIPPPPPANDEACAAIAIIPDSVCTYRNFTNINATGSLGIPDPGCANYQGEDVWFSTIVPSGGALLFDTQTGTMTDGGMAIYKGRCNALTLIACDDNQSNNGAMPFINAGGLTAGDTIWIRVWANGGGEEDGTFGICVRIPPPPPANDEPCNAFPLAVGNTCTFSTFTNENATGTTGVPAPGCANYQGGDVWFSAIVPATGHLIFNTQTGVVLDGGMAIYRGTCNALTLISCNDDSSPNGAMPLIDAPGLNPGDTIWIRVWEDGSNNNGTFGICVKEPPPPPANDEPCNAAVLLVDSTCNYQTFTSESATGSTAIPAPTCGTYDGGDVWFSVVVPNGGSVNIDMQAGSLLDAAMAVYTSATDCTGLNLIECNDNSSGNPLMPYINATGLVPGSTLWIRVWPADGPIAAGTFGICVTIPAPQPATFSFNCLKDTFLTCGLSPCFSLASIIPNIHSSTSNYEVNPLSGAGVIGGCFNPYVNPAGPGPATDLRSDDVYTPVINLPFTFPFYGINYNTLVASTNGYVSFDATNANTASHWQILENNGALGFNLGTPLDLPSTLYDRALIMGPYHDLNPFYTTSPTQKIKYNVTGTAPNRRWILSFYKVPLFTTGNAGCDRLINNSHQIVLYEGTGIVEVFVFDRERCPEWNKGRAMIGLQNFNGDQGIMAPGRAASDSIWGGIGINESWRFVPSQGPTLFKKVELFDFAGNLIATGDTTSINNTSLRASFANICPTRAEGNILKYIVKSTYTKFDDPNAIVVGTDTILVHRGTIDAAYVSTSTKCKGSADATITINPTTGVAPYFYSVTGGPAVQNGNIFTVGAGTYTVSVTDSLGCGKDTIIVITEPVAVSGTYQTIPTKCYNGGNDGTIIVTGTTGIAPYTYSVDGGSYQTSDTFTVAAGSHLVSIKDANGCIKDSNIVVGQPTPVAGIYQTINTKCNGENDGKIIVAGSGGTAPYVYAVDGGTYLSTDTFTVTAGSHPVSIKDANGCIKDTSIVVGQPPVVSGIYQTIPTKCNGSNNGTIIVAGNGGTAPYQYTISGGTYQTSDTFTVAAGSYLVGIKDANGCTKDSTIIVTEPAVLTATSLAVNAGCNPTSTGQITVTPLSGTAPYTYSIDGISFQPGNTFTPPLGNYTITIKDSNNCVAITTASISFVSDLTLQGIKDTAICENNPVQLLTQSNALSYSWAPATYLDNPAIASPLALPAVTTTYILTASTGPCTLKDTVTVLVAPTPTVNAGADITVVKGEDGPLTGAVVNAANFIWSPSTYLSSTNSLTTVSVRPQETITYTLTATNSAGCSVSDDVVVKVEPYCIKVKNAFTPNGDGVNDTWMVYDQSECLTNIIVNVYNRYGSKVYESKNYRNDWKGTYNGKSLPDATYYYVIDFYLTDGKKVEMRGDVTILR